MKVLIIDPYIKGATGCLDIAWRAQNAGHTVKYFQTFDERNKNVGKGLIERVPDFRPWIRWADFIFNADNTSYLNEMEKARNEGQAVFSSNKNLREWEINRDRGMGILKNVGVRIAPYQLFTRLADGISYIRKHPLERYVCKPCADVDKCFSYVSKSAEDMVYTMEKWRKTGKFNHPFILQEFIGGTEFAVGGFFGPNGFNDGWCENFEFKKLMNGDLGPNCYDAETEVLTIEGWKYWGEVSQKDQLATLKDGNIEFETPSKLVAKEVDTELVGWQSSTVDILVTKGHNMYVQDDHGRKPFLFEKACDIELQSRKISRGAENWVGQDVGISEPIARLLGAYIADGSCRERSIVFGNCPEHKQKIFTRYAEDCGLEAKMYGPDLYINNKDLVVYFLLLGKAHEKFVPYPVKASPRNILNAFLEGYLSGDGSVHTNGKSFSAETVSKRLADDLQEIALKLGISCCINKRDRIPSHYINGIMANSYRTSYALSFGREKTKAKLIPEIAYRTNYKGMVYCATVTSHILLCRRNGKPFLSGNTGEMGTVLRFVKNSKLANEMLVPIASQLEKENYIGYIDVNCIIDKEGKAWPLEFTTRPGWPTFNIQQALILGDPIEWMYSLCNGEDSKPFIYDEIAIGVCVFIPDGEETDEVPVYGLTDSLMEHVHPCGMMIANAPKQIGEKILTCPQPCSAGDYVLIVTSTGNSITEAREKVYRKVERLKMPSSPIYRTDIGQKLAQQLLTIQKYKYAKGLRYS